MKTDQSFSLVSYRLKRASEALRAAEIMFENQMLSFAMNRIYYAMFYAVQAILVLKNISFSKHGQVKAYFNREMIIEYLGKAKDFVGHVKEYLQKNSVDGTFDL